MELFAKPAVGGIIEKSINGIDYILIQERFKENAEREEGLIEIPAGKIREFENIFVALRREIWEETGLEVVEIKGENNISVFQSNGYKVLSYVPFSCSQNLQGEYPIMVQTFICTAKGEILDRTNETQNIRWVPLTELKEMLDNDKNDFYPMHVITLQKYLNYKLYKETEYE